MMTIDFNPTERINELEQTFGPGIISVVYYPNNEWQLVWRWQGYDFWICSDNTEVITRWQDRSSVIKVVGSGCSLPTRNPYFPLTTLNLCHSHDNPFAVYTG